MRCDGLITVLVGNGELMDRAEAVLKGFFGSAYAYAKSVVDYGVGSVALATINGVSVGAAIYYQVPVGSVRACIIYYIAVAEECRGLGIGSVLMHSIEEACRTPDIYIVTTWLGNERANGLYRSMGYIGYSWDELRMRLGRRVVNKLLKATCGYDDDIVYVKVARSGEDALSVLRRVVNGQDNIDDLWRRTCVQVWLRLRGEYS